MPVLFCCYGVMLKQQQNTRANLHIHLQRAPLCGPCFQARLCNLLLEEIKFSKTCVAKACVAYLCYLYFHSLRCQVEIVEVRF